MTFVEKVLTVAGKDGLTLTPRGDGRWECRRWSSDGELGYGLDAVTAIEDAYVKATARRII